METKRDKENPNRLDPPEEGRRGYLKAVGGLAAGLVVGGAAAWLAKPAETVDLPGATVTKTTTKTETAGVTPAPPGKLWAIMRDFNKPHMGISIDYYIQQEKKARDFEFRVDWEPSGNFPDNVLLAFQRAEPPDFVELTPVECISLGYDGVLLDHGDLIDSIEVDAFEQTAKGKEAFYTDLWPEWEGVTYALPYRLNPWALVYNKTILEQEGLEMPDPLMLDDFLDLCIKVTKGDRYGFDQEMSWTPGMPYFIGPWMWVLGGGFFSPDYTEIWIDKPESIEGFTFFVELFTKHKVVSPDTPVQTYMVRREKFAKDKALFNIDGEFGIDYWTRQGRNPGDVGIIPFPWPDEDAMNKYPRNICLSGLCFTMPKNAPNVEEAYKFLRYMMRPDIQAHYSRTSPSLKSIAEHIRYRGNAKSMRYLEMMDYSRGGLSCPKSIEMVKVIQTAYMDSIYERKTPKEACEWMAEEFRTLATWL